MHDNANDLRPDGGDVRSAVRFGLFTAVAGVTFLVVAALLVGSCHGAVADSAACGPPQRLALALGAPIILLIGGLHAFARTYRAWKQRQTWWAWQGAGWFLMMLMLLTLTMGLPAMAGPVLG